MPDPTLTGQILHDLDDHAFVIVRDGGARDSQGRTEPRGIRLGAHHNPSGRRLTMNRQAGGPATQAEHEGRSTGTLNVHGVNRVIAAINAGKLDGVRLTLAERTAAWNHMQQHAVELGIPMPPKRF